MLGHLGAISLKNLTKRKEVRKGADQAKYTRQVHTPSMFEEWEVFCNN